MGETKEYITRVDEKGSVNISEDVISVIAAAALLDVDGVDGSPAKLGSDIAEFLGKKNASRGVKIRIDDSSIYIDVFVMIRFGCAVCSVAKEVQDAVANAVGAMTGLEVAEVNVHVCGVTFDKDR